MQKYTLLILTDIANMSHNFCENSVLFSHEVGVNVLGWLHPVYRCRVVPARARHIMMKDKGRLSMKNITL